MRRQTAHGAPGRRAKILIVSFIMLAFSLAAVSQGTTAPLKPVYSAEKKLYGYVDTLTSKLVIKYQYKKAGRFHNGLAAVQKDDHYGIIDTKGKAVYPINNVSITVNTDPDAFIVRDGKNYKYGALDFNLKQVIPFEYDNIYPIGNVLVTSRFETINGRLTELSGIYNRKFEMVLPAELTSRPEEKTKGYISNTVGGPVGLMTKTGETVIPFDKNFILIYDNGRTILVQDKMNKWQAYRLDGSLISDLTFDNYRSPVEGCFPVEMNGKWGLFRDGLIVPCIYDRGDNIDIAGGTFILTKQNRQGVTDSTGREIVPYNFDKVARYGKDMFLVTNGNKSGLYNRTGKEIIPCSFAQIPAQPVNGCFILTDDGGRYGCITEEGTRLVPFVLDEYYVKDNYSTAKGYLNKLLEVSPLHPEILYLAAFGYYHNAKPEDALAYVNNLIALAGDSMEANSSLRSVRSLIYTVMDNFTAAERDALSAMPTMYSSKAFIFMGDRKFIQEDFNMAKKYYGYAGIYVNKEEAEAKELMAVGELKKRGLYKVERLEIGDGGRKSEVADLPVTLMGFAKSDRMEYAGNSQFKRLFTYSEAVAGIPAGFRMPTYEDWMKLVKHIVDDRRLSYNYEFHAVGYIGRGWNSSSTTEGVLKDKTYTNYSQDTYGLGIAPLRSYSYTVGLSDYEERNDIIRYWIEPGYHKGSQVNCITITIDGFNFSFQTTSKACVRYVKK
ncbi:MAG: WG repeat-containing protein [Bacteroidales bacterium]